MSLRIAYITLLVLTVLVLIIYLYQNYEEPFYSTSTRPEILSPLINLAAGDVHLIQDNNPSLIKTPILNYPLDTISMKDNSTSKMYISVFMHLPFQYNTTTYSPLGQYIRVSKDPLDLSNPKSANLNSDLMSDIRMKGCLNYLSSSTYYPVEYNLIWSSDILPDSGEIFSVWRPVPPPGMMALGDIIVSGTSKPVREYITCLPITMLSFSGVSNGLLWHGKNDVGLDGYCWSAGNFDTFRASNTYGATMPELELVYNLDTSVINSNLISNGSSTSRQIHTTSTTSNGIQI
jgi:hypothetical protein